MATIQSARSPRGSRSSIFGIGRAGRGDERSSTDWLLVAIVAVLLVLGLIMAYSTTFFWSASTAGSPFAIFGKQVLAAVAGVGLFVMLSRIDYGNWRRWALPLMGLGVLGLIAVLLFGDTILGAKRTLLNGSIQPSEPIKIVILLYGAAWLASRREQITSIANGLIPFAVIVGVATAFIALQPDLSTSAVILIAASAMFFMAGASVVQIVMVGGASVAFFAMLINWFPHATDRLQSFISAVGNPQDTQYHIRQSLIAIGEGGLFGNGIGVGYQKFGLLPTPQTDSVFAVLAEEMGLLGVIVTLALFAFLAYRSLRIAQNADTAFGAFWAIGLVTWIMMQALLNLLAMTGMMPLPGVPVPFLSVGGSSMVSVMAACGILVSISRGSKVLMQEDASGKDETSDTLGGRSSYSASSTIRRRNSRSRVARPNRVEKPGDDVETDIIGRDIKFAPSLGRGPDQSRSPSTFRWRSGRYGAGSRQPRGR